MILSHLACVCYTSRFKGKKGLLQLLLVFTHLFFHRRNLNSISLASSLTFPSSSLFSDMWVVYWYEQSTLEWVPRRVCCDMNCITSTHLAEKLSIYTLDNTILRIWNHKFLYSCSSHSRISHPNQAAWVSVAPSRQWSQSDSRCSWWRHLYRSRLHQGYPQAPIPGSHHFFHLSLSLSCQILCEQKHWPLLRWLCWILGEDRWPL